MNSLNALIEEFPDEWNAVKAEAIPIIKTNNFDKIKEYEKQSEKKLRRLSIKAKKTNLRGTSQNPFEKSLIQLRMKKLLINDFYQTVVRKQVEGDGRLRWLNRWIANRLFFRDGLSRKPVSYFWYKLFWPLVGQKEKVLSLMQYGGMYCSFADRFFSSVKEMVGDRTCLEIAAGDGFLTRYLEAEGVNIRATDDYTWAHRIKFPEFVEKKDAASALKEYSPQVVFCSWPPADNDFEANIFETSSVELYIVVLSRHQFASGNWQSYERQTKFKMKVGESLSRFVLPRETESEVLIFSRES